VVEEEGIDGLTTPKSSILFLSFRGHSFPVIPGTIPAECEFRSTFRRNSFINLAGNCAKIDSYGIPGIDWIPPDSGRNQWRTVKTSPGAALHEKKKWCKFMERYHPEGTFEEVSAKNNPDHRTHTWYDQEKQWQILFLQNPKAPPGCVSDVSVYGHPCPNGTYCDLAKIRH